MAVEINRYTKFGAFGSRFIDIIRSGMAFKLLKSTKNLRKSTSDQHLQFIRLSFWISFTKIPNKGISTL